jgi:hypothetical protein
VQQQLDWITQAIAHGQEGSHIMHHAPRESSQRKVYNSIVSKGGSKTFKTAVPRRILPPDSPKTLSM